ncbi:amine dehydrogenase large subunit [Derxia gummosa]|uniref:Amine dehydrogenase large subunit n=1 Tax=Derxia gummosa DSM 723 TaxID=1121388 RepID=A0A8B6X7J7_9BURK|nr:amine dehydrogenase large subunit [Derxia gummosa]
MKTVLTAIAAAIGIMTANAAFAADEFVPETLSVEKEIKPGPNAFILDQNWRGASRVNVFSTDDLTNKGLMSLGLTGNFLVSKDAKTAWTISVFPKRIVHGPLEAVLQEHDVKTLTIRREIAISEKMAQSLAYSSLLKLSADEKYALVQNATPASSVSVVDLAAGKEIGEVPTPGCWGVYALPEGLGFSTLCGDGTLATFRVNANGSYAAPVKSEKFFDADTDAVFMHAERAGKELLFISFTGNLFRIDNSGAQPKVKEKYNFAAAIPGGWRPGGYQISAYNAANNVLFVGMHPEGHEGSHKEPASEVWALDLKTKTVQYRSAVEKLSSIFVSADKAPVLIGLSETADVTRYEIDPTARYAAKPTHKLEKIGEYTQLGYATGEAK